MQSNLQALDTYSVMTGDRRYEKLLGESEGVSICVMWHKD